MRKTLPYLIIAIGIAAFYYFRYRVAPNIELQKIRVTDTSGRESSLSEVATNMQSIHFYASWCGPCMREMGILKKEYDNLLKAGIKIICVTDDSWDKIEQLKSNMPEGLQFYQIKSLKEIGVYTIPTTYFLNSKSEIVKKQIDVCAWEDSAFLEEIKKITQ